MNRIFPTKKNEAGRDIAPFRLRPDLSPYNICFLGNQSVATVWAKADLSLWKVNPLPLQTATTL